MDATQEARAAEINAALQKRGADAVTGEARRALVAELGVLLSGPEELPLTLTPEQQGRANDITRRLQDHAAGKPDAHLDVFERGRLRDELAQLLGAGEVTASPASTDGSGDAGAA
jgi:hypothetical protein